MADVIDISTGGMRLLVHYDRILPPKFDIEGLLEQARLRVRRVWRRHNEVGVRLIKTAICR